MRNFFKKVLSENTEVSAMRLMSFISLLVASALAFIGMYKGVSLDALATLCGVFLGAGFIGKASQKFAEKPSQPPQDKDHSD